MRTFFKRLIAILLLVVIAAGAIYGLYLVMSHVGQIAGLTMFGKGYELADFIFGLMLYVVLLFLSVMIFFGSVFFASVIAGVCNPYGERSALLHKLRLD